MKEHVVITGCAGFIGSHLTMTLLSLGYRVTGIDNLSYGSAKKMNSFSGQKGFNFIEADAANIKNLILAPVDVIIHLASEKIPRYSSGYETLQNNLRIGEAVIDFAIEKKSFILFASTSDVYGKNPTIPFTEESDCVLGSSLNKRWTYAGSKLITEMKLAAAGRAKGLRFQIMRFFGCYGPGMNSGWRSGPQQVFFEKALKKNAMEIHGDGKQTRTYIFIDDLIKGVLLLLNHVENDNQIWNFSSPVEEEISVIHLAKKIHKLVNGDDEFKPTFIPYSEFGDYEEVKRRVGSSQKAEQLLGWKAETKLDDGLLLTYRWIQGI
ncbi:MAG: NAD-dependent epimerase/dehydratase family protein [Bacteroidia bacterium]